MTRTLEERFESAKSVLDEAGAALGTSPASLPSPVEEQFRRSLSIAASIAYWQELLAARRAARSLLDGLEKRASVDDTVEVFSTATGAASAKMQFAHARLIGVEAYLSLSWAIADRVVGAVGRILCTAHSGFNDNSQAKLVSHFIEEEKYRVTTAGITYYSIRQTFGWPVGVSYALRNHFVHDGGEQKDVEFFAGRTAGTAFHISEKGWQHVEKRAYGYGVERGFVRASAGWPSSPKDDLRMVLAVCEREMDEAMGIILGSACRALAFHLGFMLGND